MGKFSRVVLALLSLYIAFTLPIVLVFAQSEYTRFIVSQVVTKWKGKLSSVESAYLGDSLTAGGRNWGEFPNALNLGANDVFIRQIVIQVETAKRFNPLRIYIQAGTNDLLYPQHFGEQFDLERFKRDYAALLDAALGTGAKVLVTEVFYTANSADIPNVKRANSTIRDLASARNVRVVLCNDLLAPEGILLSKYTVDGVHLSQAAYDEVWIPRLRQALEHSGP